MHDLVEEQFILAKFGISLTESMMLPDFERIALVGLAIEYQKQQAQSMGLSAD